MLFRSVGADKELDYNQYYAPNNVYVNLIDTIEVTPGSTFNLQLIANEAGPASSTTVYQDLRYTKAFLFHDWNRNGEFTSFATYGVSSPSGNPNNVLANYDTVMNIDHAISVPSDAQIGPSKIRIVYNNAWNSDATACSTNIVEGMAYDVNVKVMSKDTGIKNNQAIGWRLNQLCDDYFEIIAAQDGLFTIQIMQLDGSIISSDNIQISSNKSIRLKKPSNRGFYMVVVRKNQDIVKSFKLSK